MSQDHELLTLLDLETLDTDLFRGFNPPHETRRIYGGQVVAQALAAAYRTIEDRVCHSLHCYFIRPGDPRIPILFQVDRARDGGSFSVRRVVAIQNGKQIFNLAASFQVPETGEAGLDPASRRIWPVELKPCEPVPHGFVGVREPVDMCWFRTRMPLGDDVAVNQCALAYGSDMTLMDASLRPHGVDWDSGRLQAASLDHAMWFHQPSDFHDWHLFVQDSPSASGGRGFNRGQIYARDGRLVAEAAQEALIRWR